MTENKTEFVVHPNHYNQCKYECWDVFEDILLNKEYSCAIGAYMANAFKYIWRCGSKAGDYGKNQNEKNIEDIKKAMQYLDRAINIIRKEDELVKRENIEYKFDMADVLNELSKNKEKNIPKNISDKLNKCLSLMWNAGDVENDVKYDFSTAKNILNGVLVDFESLN